MLNTQPAIQTNSLIGHNGAGKTTLNRLLLGVLQPTRGNSRLFGGGVGFGHTLSPVRKRMTIMALDWVVIEACFVI